MVPTHFINNYQEYLFTKIIKNTPPANLIFMDEACKRSHTEYYKLNFEDSPVIPLPMTIVGKELSDYYDKRKIVSVGRITDFKPYPFGVVKALKKLNDNKKLSFKYHIIGDGCNFLKLKKLISDLKMEDDVILHGTVPYFKINDLIKDACYFIGMGTTVGEAAGIGIPSIVAIVDEENESYGLLGRLPNNILGESGEDLPTKSYEELLDNLSNLTTDAYKKERQLSLEKSNYYAVENVADSFINVFKKGTDAHLKISILDLLFYKAAKIQLKFFLKKRYKQK
jgi:glycosyltransferase involved in cell wall biosynthesis